MMKKLCQLIGKYFGLIAVLFLILGMTMPQNFTWVVGKIGGVAVLSTLLGIVMFGMGTTLDLKDFALVLKRPLDVFIGACAQFLIMPGLAYVIATAFDLDPALTAGVVLVGTCPGGTSSNVITFMSKGDVALSVTMTSVSTVLSPILTPFITYKLIGERIAFDPIGMFWSIVQIVIVPICLGLAVKYFLPKLAIAPYVPNEKDDPETYYQYVFTKELGQTYVDKAESQIEYDDLLRTANIDVGYNPQMITKNREPQDSYEIEKCWQIMNERQTILQSSMFAYYFCKLVRKKFNV